MPLPPPTRAFDVHILPRHLASRAGVDGWCFGLPPGISQAQWPLSLRSGFPMFHGFTILVPEDYRTPGEDLVALSLFCDEAYHERDVIPQIADFMAAPSMDPPKDAAFLPFWTYLKERHAREFIMPDILDTAYAAIWLTRAEFEAPVCQPPDFSRNRLLAGKPPPAWIAAGNARAFWNSRFNTANGLPPERHHIHQVLGEVPEIGHHAWGLKIVERHRDPNVGKTPVNSWEPNAASSDYIDWWSERGKAVGLDRIPYGNHFGGTMKPAQKYPPFGPHYFEFEETLGGFNFAGGNAQIDLAQMKFDWAH